MNFALRPARPQDGPILAEIEKECFPDPTWLADDFRQYETVVAEYEGRIVGFIVTHQVFAGSATEPLECEVLNLAVVPLVRGMGVATALLKQAIPRAARCSLEVRESNTAARKLYKKLGFQETGKRPVYYENPPEAAIVMLRK